MRAIPQEIHQASIIEISLKITYPKFYANLQGANELTSGHADLTSTLKFLRDFVRSCRLF